MSDSTSELALYDVTARKVHQWSVVALIATGLVAGPQAAIVLLTVAGAVMLLGRFWWPADVFRQLTWRVLEPAGLLHRREVTEDHQTRRVARVLGGAAWLVAAALIALQLPLVGWALALAVAGMVVLDAAADFCVLCFVAMRMRR